MLDLQRNNLDHSVSPYLLQHRSQGIWWQEWQPDVLQAARDLEKPLLVSIGYATCHWCHVMAAGAFSDPDTIQYLNEQFICIKIDRELRPDIDQVMMQYLLTQSGSGGWPLNVFLTPDQRPIYALMYAPARQTPQMPAFREIARRVIAYDRDHRQDIAPYVPHETPPPAAAEASLGQQILQAHDRQNGGFGRGIHQGIDRPMPPCCTCSMPRPWPPMSKWLPPAA
jgi:uncharacterized protein YyaL (SSP411 family)